MEQHPHQTRQQSLSRDERRSGLKGKLKQLTHLWRQFIPLSLSDVTMFFGDPLMNTTMAHLPEARLNLAAVGVAKAQAIFFESPIIMMLHASNALASSPKARRALWYFMLVSILVLSGLLFLLTLPSVFALIGPEFLGIDKSLLDKSRVVLTILILWPAAIGWRRYYQGVLIRSGHNKVVGLASMGRLALTALVLALGYALRLPGHVLAGLTLLGGVVFEALFVTVAAKRFHLFYHYPLWVRGPDIQEAGNVGHATGAKGEEAAGAQLPSTVGQVWKFYWPLANSMLVVWGGRALLVAILARAVDGPMALASWPVAWSLVILVANATRMVQQIIIKNRGQVSEQFLLFFAGTVGIFFSLLLLGLGLTPFGVGIVNTFVGDDLVLRNNVLNAIKLSGVLPLLVALQNAFQGFLIAEGRTTRVNVATWIGTFILLGVTILGVLYGQAGVISASIAVMCGLVIELGILALGIFPHGSQLKSV